MYAQKYDLHGMFPKGFILQTPLPLNRKKKVLWYPVPSLSILFKRLLTLFRRQGQIALRGAIEMAWKTMLDLF